MTARRLLAVTACCALLALCTLAAGARHAAAGPGDPTDVTTVHIDETNVYGPTSSYWDPATDNPRWDAARAFGSSFAANYCYMSTGSTTGWFSVAGGQPRELTDQELADMNDALWIAPPLSLATARGPSSRGSDE